MMMMMITKCTFSTVKYSVNVLVSFKLVVNMRCIFQPGNPVFIYWYLWREGEIGRGPATRHRMPRLRKWGCQHFMPVSIYFPLSFHFAAWLISLKVLTHCSLVSPMFLITVKLELKHNEQITFPKAVTHTTEEAGVIIFSHRFHASPM